MNRKTPNQIRVGMATMLLLALAQGMVNPPVLGGEPATPVDSMQAEGFAQTAAERDVSIVEGRQALLKGGCILCAGAILIGGGASIIGLIAFAAVAPFATGACSFVCTLGFG